jgi:parvulin-like peptidyl-prolyl isomerase
MSYRNVIVVFVLIALIGCSKSPEKTTSAPVPAAKQKVVLEIGDYKVSDGELQEILKQMPVDQKARYLGRGQKGMEELLNDIAERHIVAEAARAKKMDDDVHVQAGLLVANDSVLYSAFYRKEVLDKVVPESEIKAFYDKNKERLLVPEQIKIRQIFVSPRPETEIKNTEGNDAKTEGEAKQKIDRIAGELKGGADFATLAKQWSEDPSATSGGELPWFGKGRMIPVFEEAAFKLNPGQISEPLKTEFGYYILKGEEKREKIQIPYEQVRDQIQNQLATNRSDLIEKMYAKIIEDLKTKYPQKLHPENLSH